MNQRTKIFFAVGFICALLQSNRAICMHKRSKKTTETTAFFQDGHGSLSGFFETKKNGALFESLNFIIPYDSEALNIEEIFPEFHGLRGKSLKYCGKNINANRWFECLHEKLEAASRKPRKSSLDIDDVFEDVSSQKTAKQSWANVTKKKSGSDLALQRKSAITKLSGIQKSTKKKALS